VLGDQLGFSKPDVFNTNAAGGMGEIQVKNLILFDLLECLKMIPQLVGE